MEKRELFSVELRKPDDHGFNIQLQTKDSIEEHLVHLIINTKGVESAMFTENIALIRSNSTYNAKFVLSWLVATLDDYYTAKCRALEEEIDDWLKAAPKIAEQYAINDVVPIHKLEAELKAALDKEDYMKAAELRDKIAERKEEKP